MTDEAEDAVLPRLLGAFPRSVAADVRTVAALLPSESAVSGRAFSADSIDGRRTVLGLHVQGDPIVIPSRLYLDEPAEIGDLTDVQHVLLGCLYSRHHDGYVRQRWLRTILPARQAWVVPYVVQLAGEYVLPILRDLSDFLVEIEDVTSARAPSSTAGCWRRTLGCCRWSGSGPGATGGSTSPVGMPSRATILRWWSCVSSSWSRTPGPDAGDLPRPGRQREPRPRQATTAMLAAAATSITLKKT